VLSGDVHHSYVARADLPGDPPARVHQLTCSPVHNKIHWIVRPGFQLGWSRAARRVAERWALRVGAPPKPVSWERQVGPVFGNTIATLDLTGTHAETIFEQPHSSAGLVERARLDLTR